MWKIVAHYDDKELTIQTTPERDTARELYQAKTNRRDCIAVFMYENNKLQEHAFMRA